MRAFAVNPNDGHAGLEEIPEPGPPPGVKHVVKLAD
jgi:hypothetical protein